MCNDNLSGIAVATALARILALNSHRYTYRFLFVPGTIGPIAWLSRNQDKVSRIKHGLVLACVGDRGCVNYKRSRRLTADIDRAVEHVLQTRGAPFKVRDFSPYGYDERQFCSPGFNLPVGSFRRTPHGEYPEYHTSADDLNLRVAHTPCRFARHAARGDRSVGGRRQISQPQSYGGASIGTEGTSAGSQREGTDGVAVDAQSFGRHEQYSRYCRALRLILRRASLCH